MLHRAAFAALTGLLVVACSSDGVTPPVLAGTESVANVTVNKAEFTLSGTTDDEYVFNVASDGEKALVPYIRNQAVELKLVRQTGSSVSIALTNPYTSYAIQTAYGGGYYYVIWPSGGAIWAQRISAAGVVTEAAFQVSSTFFSDPWPSGIGYAYASGKFLVTYQDLASGNLLGRVVKTDMSMGPEFTIAAAAAQPVVTLHGGNAVASDGTSFLVAYYAARAPGYGVFAKKVTVSGTLSAQATVDTLADYGYGLLGTAYSGGTYLVTFSTTDVGVTGLNYDVTGRLVKTSGTPAGAPFAIVRATGKQFALQPIRYRENFLVTYWNAPQDGNWVVRGRRVSKTGVLGAPQALFSKNVGTGKIALPFGVAIGTKVFFAVQRGTLGSVNDPFVYSATDLDAAIVTP